MNFIKKSITKLPITLTTKNIFQCTQQNIFDSSQKGTQYTNWVLARASDHNHDIARCLRKYPKDRYSIHKLTNLDFMSKLILHDFKYNLNQNQKIVLLAQFNHIIKVLGRKYQHFESFLNRLVIQIYTQMQNPPDLICLGTFMSALVSMDYFSDAVWIVLVDSILANKFDQQYDQLFGIIISLNKYLQRTKLSEHYLIISQDQVIPKIPIIYRNNTELIRKYVTYNIYNLKQCRLLFQALFQSNINERYFWNSMRDWFNIYTKEQLNKKQMSEYFIMKQCAIEKVLHDHGMIRPRPILQQLSSIAYILSEFGNTSWRFIEFAQDLILYTIENGSLLFEKYQEIALKQQKEQYEQKMKQTLIINKHIKVKSQQQQQNIKQFEKKYKTIFINPIQIKNNFIINFLVVICRSYKQYQQPQTKFKQQQQNNFYDKNKSIYLDPRVKKWILLQLVKDQMQYTTTELLKVHQCRQFLIDSKINLQQFIAFKLCNLRNTITKFTQLQQLMKVLPRQKYYNLNFVIVDFLTRNHPSQILLLTKHIQKHDLWNYMRIFVLKLPTSINFHQKYFSFQQNCYFMLMLLQNSYTIDSTNNDHNLIYEYEGQMEKLKQSIKIATYGRGFKISINSYFHQILNHINIVQFFQGGRS